MSNIAQLQLLTLALIQEGPTDQSMCAVWTSFTFALVFTDPDSSERELLMSIAEAWGYTEAEEFDAACKQAYLRVTPKSQQTMFLSGLGGQTDV